MLVDCCAVSSVSSIDLQEIITKPRQPDLSSSVEMSMELKRNEVCSKVMGAFQINCLLNVITITISVFCIYYFHLLHELYNVTYFYKVDSKPANL